MNRFSICCCMRADCQDTTCPGAVMARMHWRDGGMRVSGSDSLRLAAPRQQQPTTSRWSWLSIARRFHLSTKRTT